MNRMAGGALARRAAAALVLLALAASGMVSAPAGANAGECAPASPPPGAPIVWTVGDSLTVQYSPCLAELRPTWRVVQHAQNGETSAAGVARLRHLIETTVATNPAALPKVAVIAYGTNDVVADRFNGEPGYDTASIVRHVDEIRALFAARGVKVVIATPYTTKKVRVPPSDPRYESGLRLVQGLNDLAKAMRRYFPKQKPRVRVVTFQVPQRANPREFFAEDGIHASSKGARHMARKVSTALKPLLARP